MFQAKKVGGITFLQFGRINVSVSVSKSRPSAVATICGAVVRGILAMVPEMHGTAALSEDSRQTALRRYEIHMRNKAHDLGVRSFW